MKIKGLQKVTLIDYPDKLACTIFLFGCNFRCGFCHNPGLVLREDSKDFSEEEVLEFLKERKKYLEGICITGGEPLLTLDEKFLKKIKDLGYKIKIDTNGSFPKKLKEFVEKGLVDFVAMDIKCSKENYQKVSNSKIEISKIEESIKLIGNLEGYEFRTTIVEGIHNEEEVVKLANWLNDLLGKKPERFCLQGFKNHGEVVDENYKTKKDLPESYLWKLKELLQDYFEKIEIKA